MVADQRQLRARRPGRSSARSGVYVHRRKAEFEFEFEKQKDSGGRRLGAQAGVITSF